MRPAATMCLQQAMPEHGGRILKCVSPPITLGFIGRQTLGLNTPLQLPIRKLQPLIGRRLSAMRITHMKHDAVLCVDDLSAASLLPDFVLRWQTLTHFSKEQGA